MAALALAACHGEEPVIPDEPSPAQWAAFADAGLADGFLGDAPLPDVCTELNGQAMTMRVVNTTGAPVVTFWVDAGCVERMYQQVPAGESRDQMSFVGHVWRFRTPGGALLRQVTLEETPLQEVEL